MRPPVGPSTAWVAVALAISSCATTTRLWRDPNYRPTPVHRLFVVVGIPEQVPTSWAVRFRVSFENVVAQSLINSGFEAATSSSVFPPGKLDDEKVAAFVKEMNVDLVIVSSPSTSGCQDAYQACIAVQTSVYVAGRPDVPIWSGISTTSVGNPSLYAGMYGGISPADAAGYLAPSLVQDLVKSQILVR